ncbi:hypothetical protein Tco_0432053 [Tanacetum coccineum]
MKGGLKWSASAILLGGQILDEFWTLWINEFLKGICKRIIREVFVKLLSDSFGKLCIRTMVVMKKVESTVSPASTADPEVSAVELRTPPTTTSIFDDEDITMAQTLIKMKEEKAKEKGVAFKYVEDSSRPVRSITTLKPLPSIDPKDKGKGILVEEERIKIKRKDQGIDQIKRDEELAHKNLLIDISEDMVWLQTLSDEAKTFEKSKLYLVSKKRKGGPRMKRMSKRKKIESDLKEEEDLKTFIKIILVSFNLGDARGLKTITPEGVDLVLCWNFYENYGAHTLTLEDGTDIHMLTERKYLLTKETLERMMSLKLIAESASDCAYDLLRFIQKQIDVARSHDGGEKDL